MPLPLLRAGAACAQSARKLAPSEFGITDPEGIRGAYELSVTRGTVFVKAYGK